MNDENGTQAIEIAENPEFGKVRIRWYDNQYMFAGKDVAKALGYKRPENAVTQHCKGILKLGMVEYLVSSVNDRISMLVPWLDTLNCGLFGEVSGVGDGWKHVDLGMGNHLFLKEEIYYKVNPKFAGKRPPEIYQEWRDDVAETVLN